MQRVDANTALIGFSSSPMRSNGTIADATNGAQYFFSSKNLSGDTAKAAPPGFFKNGFADGTLSPSQYQGHNGYRSRGHPTRNYFATLAPKGRQTSR